MAYPSNEPIIAFCGNDCSVCPRYAAKSNEELQIVAELWHRVGWRDSHGLIDCIKNKNVRQCSQCSDFPRANIDKMLGKTKLYEEKCRTLCSDSEFMILNKAFFEKETNIAVLR